MPPKVTTEVKVNNVPVFFNPDYLVFSLTSIKTGVEETSGNKKRTAWYEYASPLGQAIQVAFPLHTGAGPVPENCYSPQYIEDHIANMIKQSISAIETVEKDMKGEW